MRIFAEDNEEVKEGKRRINEEEMRKDHQRGALLLPLGILETCKVEQPREQQEHISPPTYIIGDTQYTNGEVRNYYKNGHGKFSWKWGFAGRAKQEQLEFN